MAIFCHPKYIKHFYVGKFKYIGKFKPHLTVSVDKFLEVQLLGETIYTSKV